VFQEGDLKMNFSKYLAIFTAVIFFLPLAAFARERNQGPLRLADPVEIGSTRLEPGTYRVEWSGNGPAVQVNILQGKKTVATTSGKLKKLQRPSADDDVILRPVANSDLRTIAEIDLNHRREALQLTPTMVSQK